MEPIKSSPHSRSPLTPLFPYAGRFNFSPSAINRLLAKDVMPTVLKKGRMSQRVFTPNQSPADLSTPSVSPIWGDYKIPANSPANLQMPPPKTRAQLKQQRLAASGTKLVTPTVNLINESGDSVSNLISPMQRLGQNKTTPKHDDSSESLMDSSFDAVVKSAMKSQPIRAATNYKVVGNHAHLNEHLSVTNVLDGIDMSHLGPVFEREEIDLNVFTTMTSSDLASIGIVGDEQTAVLSAIQTFRE